MFFGALPQTPRFMGLRPKPRLGSMAPQDPCGCFAAFKFVACCDLCFSEASWFFRESYRFLERMPSHERAVPRDKPPPFGRAVEIRVAQLGFEDRSGPIPKQQAHNKLTS